MKTSTLHFNDQKFAESKDNIIFEDSLVSGTKINIPGQKKHLQKKHKEVEEKRQKIEEIQKKYDKSSSQNPKKRMNRGNSFQDQERTKGGQLKKGTVAGKSQIRNDSNQQELANVELKSSKITAQKRDTFKHKKGSEMVSEKIKYRAKRNMEDEMIDEKLNTQTFRFTNQFKSELDGDHEYFKEDTIEHEELYDDYIAEEIESRSQDSPRNNARPMRLRKDTGPIEIPSDTNPVKSKKHKHEESAEQVGTPLNKPPKAPQKVNSKNVFQSPANHIFTTKRQRETEEQQERYFLFL